MIYLYNAELLVQYNFVLNEVVSRTFSSWCCVQVAISKWVISIDISLSLIQTPLITSCERSLSNNWISLEKFLYHGINFSNVITSGYFFGWFARLFNWPYCWI